jgi:hypothetical protein
VRTLGRPADLEDVRRRILTLRPDRSALWGRMSAHQMVCHLCEGCRMATGELPVKPLRLGTPALRKAVALWLPWPWPAGLPTSPEIDQQARGSRSVAFASDVAELLDLVEQVASAPALDGHSHPVFGRMSKAQWLRWAYLHLDHHLRQFGA